MVDLDLRELEISFYLQELGYDELVSIYEAILQIERGKRAEAELKAADLESGFWRKIKRMIKKKQTRKRYIELKRILIFSPLFTRAFILCNVFYCDKIS